MAGAQGVVLRSLQSLLSIRFYGGSRGSAHINAAIVPEVANRVLLKLGGVSRLALQRAEAESLLLIVNEESRVDLELVLLLRGDLVVPFNLAIDCSG